MRAAFEGGAVPVSRRDFLAGGVTAVALPRLGLRSPNGGSSDSRSSYELWYERPAVRWFEALPIGNGRMGAMIYGGTQTERIALSE